MEIDLDIPLSAVKSPLIQQFHQYWATKRGARLLPSWADINPVEIRSLLPHMLVVSIEPEPFRIFYRLVGTRVVEFRHELTGRYLDQIDEFPPHVREELEAEYRLVFTRRTPTYSKDVLQSKFDMAVTFYGSIFPLSDDGERVDRCVAIEDYEGQNPDDIAPADADQGYGRKR